MTQEQLSKHNFYYKDWIIQYGINYAPFEDEDIIHIYCKNIKLGIDKTIDTTIQQLDNKDFIKYLLDDIVNSINC